MSTVHHLPSLRPGQSITLTTESETYVARILSSSPAHESRSFAHEVNGRLSSGHYVEILSSGDDLDISVHTLQ